MGDLPENNPVTIARDHEIEVGIVIVAGWHSAHQAHTDIKAAQPGCL